MVFAPNGADFAVLIATTRSGSATGKGLNSIASPKLNMAEVAPMPMAMEQIATAVKPGSLRSTRKACLTDVMGPCLADFRDSDGFAQLHRHSGVSLFRAELTTCNFKFIHGCPQSPTASRT